MELRSWKRLVPVLLVLSLVACGKKKPPASISDPLSASTTNPEGDDSSASAEFGAEGSDSSSFGSSDINRGLAVEGGNEAAAEALQRIHFDYDSSELTEEGRGILEQNTTYLRSNPSLQVEIGGHCDERGSTDYNIALGERRAQAAYRYLVNLGNEPDRFRVISFGEDRPLSFGHTDYDYAMNRRVEFRPLN